MEDNITIANILNLYNNEIRKNVKNKKKINDFEKYKIQYVCLIYDILKSGNYDNFKYNIFLIKDPKYRIIMSQSIFDKIINHFISRYMIEPKLSKYLDMRNVATRKGMGSNYGHKLLKTYLEEEKRKNNIFYILKIDIAKYFYNIDHEVLRSLLYDKLTVKENKFIDIILNSTDEDYINETIIRLKEEERKRNPKRVNDIESLPLYNKGKGLAIGVMTNQFLAIFYLYKLHNYIIHKLHIKHLVIYMDDYILMHPSKQYLKECLVKIENILTKEYKLMINTKKTRITSCKEGFIFLGYRYQIINNKTIITLRRDTLNKVKRTIKKNKYLFTRGEISFKTMFSSFSNYNNCFSYSKEKVRRILDKYG